MNWIFNVNTVKKGWTVNDDGIFSANEVVASEQVALADTDFAFTLDISGFTVAELLGEHTMRVRGEDESGGDFRFCSHCLLSGL